MWNFGNFGNFNPWGNLGQWKTSDLWKNWGSGFGGLWGSLGQQPANPTSAPAPAKPADQMEMLNRIINLAKQLMPDYDYLTMQLSTALDTHRADCIAYSLWVYIACRAVGIPCELIFCTQDINAIVDKYHVFNKVVLNGVPYWTDITYVFWGDEGCRAFQIPKEGQAGMAAYYLIGVDGSACQLEGLDLNLPPKDDQQFCLAASLIVGQTEKKEHAKCQDRVVAELKAAGLL